MSAARVPTALEESFMLARITPPVVIPALVVIGIALVALLR
jgi:hypothetical protein